MYFKSLDGAIAAWLRTTGTTQGQLARELGMAENSLSWKRRGIRSFTLEEACRLAHAIGLGTLDGALSEYEEQ